MALFKCDLKIEGLEELKQTLSGDLIRKAMRSALDQSGTFGKKQIVELVTTNWNIDKPSVENKLTVTRTTQTNNEIVFRVKSTILSLYHHFHAFQANNGVIAPIGRRSDMRIPHAFIRRSKKGWTGVLIRTTRKNYPLSWKTNRGPSITVLVKKIWDIAEIEIVDYFKWVFWNQIERRTRIKF